MQSKNTLTQARLKELLEYDPETGVFTRIKTTWKRTDFVGKPAGCIDNGYIRILVDRSSHMAHRLAVLYMTGEWPDYEVDHINRVRHDNRWDNLREATHRENFQNLSRRSTNTSGYIGVSWRSDIKKWFAQITNDYDHQYLGCYDTAEEAHSAYLKAKARLHAFNPVPRDA